ncbi:MAG: flagellar hook-associated protein FlgL [Anaerolineae bacterium]|nr:flagellar hook-associated protein FlgL [Anaerolineae bacterium]
MRVTQQLLNQSALNGMQNNLRRVKTLQEQAATSKKVNRPEDDPFAVEQTLGFRSRIKASETARKNIAMSQDWLDATDKALGDISDLLTRTRSLALKGASDTLGPDERQALATEVDGIIEQAIAIGNTRHGDHYLFAGFQVDTQPFSRNPATGSVTSTTYNGDNGQIIREVEPGTDMVINTPGDTLFTNVFNTFINLRNTLQASPFVTSDVASVATDLEDKLDNVLDVQAATGTKIRRLEASADRMEASEVGMRELLSDAEDTDLAEVASQLSQQQFVYQTALAVNGQILRTSLLDYLR